MILQQLFEPVPEARIFGNPNLRATGLAYHSQRVSPGEVFFAIRGFREDGTRFIPDALARGAVAVVSESVPAEDAVFAKDAVAWIQVPNARKALALAANRFYDAPSRELRLVGITGTNGKTTTAFLLASILEAAGWKPALLGTIEYRVAFGESSGRWPAAQTTPESLDLQRMLRDVVQAGGRSTVMEVSSHSLALERVTGCSFHAAVFTNFARDHLDFHGDVENYYAAKEKLFLPSAETPAPAFAVLNADDARFAQLRSRIASPVATYAVKSAADVRASKWKAGLEGLEMTVATPAGVLDIRSALLGRHNLYNLLAAIAAAAVFEVTPDQIRQGIAALRVPGRMEMIALGQPFAVIVDYAHTDEALRNLLASARELNPQGRLLLVFGCGGERDRTKRPLMGQAAGAADWSVATSDNPRSEDPLGILNDVVVGLQKAKANYVIETDRARGIEKAIREARPGDMVLIAGKGHEGYQIVGDQKIPFDDREVARAALRRLGYGSE